MFDDDISYLNLDAISFHIYFSFKKKIKVIIFKQFVAKNKQYPNRRDRDKMNLLHVVFGWSECCIGVSRLLFVLPMTGD